MPLLTILERALAELSSLLFELLDGTLVDATALVDQVTSGGRLAGIDVSDDWDVRSVSAASRAIGLSIRLYSPTTLTWVFSFPIFD